MINYPRKYIVYYHYIYFNIIYIHVAANKPNAKRNEIHGFISYAPNSPPLNSLVKNKTSFIFLW